MGRNHRHARDGDDYHEPKTARHGTIEERDSTHSASRDLPSLAIARIYCMVTMREVAKEAGCSVATVSRALNGGARVDDATREQIQRAARAVGYYRKDRSKIDGGQTPTRTVGLVIPTLEKFNYTLSMSLMQRALAQADYQLILCCHDEDPQSERALLKNLIEHRVDAIVHVPSGPNGASTLLGENPPMPVVEFYRKSSERNVDAVVADDKLGSYELVRYLLEFGHTRIALISDDNDHSTSVSRAEGFTLAISESDLSGEDCPILFRPQFEFASGSDWGHDAVKQLMQMESNRRPTAILSTTTHIALGVMEECRRFGLEIPTQMSLVVFSSAEWLDLCDPPLTRYQNPLREMGLMAAQIVLNRLNMPSVADLEPSSVKFAGRLIIRNSVAEPKKAAVATHN